jgi:hypothetical protein
MRIIGKTAIILGMALSLWANGQAGAADRVTIRIYNDSAEDLVVTVYDLNAASPGAALVGQRINGFAWIPLSVIADADGKGHIIWNARAADDTFRRCGRQNRDTLGDDDSVSVFADSSCASRAAGY